MNEQIRGQILLRALDAAPVQGLENMLQTLEVAAELSPQIKSAIGRLAANVCEEQAPEANE